MAGIMEPSLVVERMEWQAKYFGFREEIPKEDKDGELA